MISSLESKVCFFFFCSVLFFTRRIPITVTTAKQLTYLCHFLHFHFSPSKQNEHSVFKKMAYFTDDRLHKSWRIFIRISAYLLYFLKNCLFWLCWVFICAQGFLFFFLSFFLLLLFLFVFFSCGKWWLLLLWSSDSRAHWLQQLQLKDPWSRAQAWQLWCVALVTKAHGIIPDQGSNLCLLHWQVDSLLLSHQGSPILSIFKAYSRKIFLSQYLVREWIQ